ncbi:MAG: Dabb family protein [Acidimicrobiales bacterium]
MSLRHVVLLRFHEGTEASQVDALVAGLRELPALIEGLRSFQTGADLGLAAGNWDLGIAVEFDDEATWAAYQAHPEHQRGSPSSCDPSPPSEPRRSSPPDRSGRLPYHPPP